MCDAGAVTDPYEEFAAALARFVARTHDAERAAEEFGEDLIRKRRFIDALMVDFSRDAARFAATGLWEEQCWVSPIAWLTNCCNMTPGEAGGALCAGQNASSLQRTVERVADGSIGFAHLVLMATTTEALQSSGAKIDKARLLKRAESRTPHEFRRDCAHARHRADAAAFHARQQELADERSLEIQSLGGEDGGFWVKGFIDAVGRHSQGGARAARAPARSRRRPQSWAAAGGALVEMAGYTLNTGGQGATHCQVPHLQITATLDTVLLASGAAAGELDGSVPISAPTVQRFSCSASVRRILLDEQSLAVDVGRARRMPATATAIRVKHRDDGCVWPRCRRTVRWVEIHHVEHWTRDHGETTEDNLVCLCWKHHDDVHLRGWQIARVPGQREVLTIPPIPPSDPLNRGPAYERAA